MNDKKNKISADIFSNIIFSIISAASILWVIRFASNSFIASTLGLFLLSRKVGSTLANFFQLGLSKSITRYVSINIDDNRRKQIYVVVSLIIWLIEGVIIFFIYFILKDYLAKWIFPGVENNNLLTIWTVAFIWALIINFLVRSTLISERKILLANVIETFNASGFLIIALIIFKDSNDIYKILRFHSLAIIGFSLVALCIYIFGLARMVPIEKGEILSSSRTLLRFGFPRSIIASLDMVILLLGPWVLRNNLEKAGYLIIALSLLRMIQSLIKPIMEITSTITARYIGKKNTELIDKGIRLLFGTVLYLSIMVVAFLLPWKEFLISLWLDEELVIVGVSYYFSILVWGIVPFAIFHSLKGIVEMKWLEPYNLFSLTFALFIQLLSFLILKQLMSVDKAVNISIVLCYLVLGILTIYWLKAEITPFSDYNLVIFLISVVMQYFINLLFSHTPNPLSLILSFISSLLIFAVYVYLVPSKFIRYVKETVISG